MNFTEAILPIVRETRGMLLPYYGAVEVIANKSDSPHDTVTQLDLDVERYFASALKKVDPDAGFTGEELGGDTDKEVFWICDPIDGTAHFVRGLPFCTTMLARIEKGIVTFSVIYDFVNDILYHAEKGCGAFQNGKPIHVSNRLPGDAYLVVETHIDKKENTDIMVRVRNIGVVMNTINCGWEFAMVASGKIEARICVDAWGKDWDYAPGSLLVAEAGGIVANLGARSYDYRNHDFIAASPLLFAKLTEGPDAIFPIR